MGIRNDVMSLSRRRDVTLMLGLLSRRKKENEGQRSENMDVARLFFDSFSKRVGTVEDGIKTMSTEIQKLKISADRSQLSDLVLLERLQKVEGLVRESLNWIKEGAEISRQVKEGPGIKEVSIGAIESSAAPVGVEFE